MQNTGHIHGTRDIPTRWMIVFTGRHIIPMEDGSSSNNRERHLQIKKINIHYKKVPIASKILKKPPE